MQKAGLNKSAPIVTDQQILAAFVRTHWTESSGIRCIGQSKEMIQVVVDCAASAANLPTSYTHQGKRKDVSVYLGSADLADARAMRKLVVRDDDGELFGSEG